MRKLRQNTATRITVGPFIDVTDGITPEIALTVTSELLTFVVDTGGVPTLVIDAAPTASGGDNDMVHITSDAAGFYDLELTAAQTNYVGRAIMSINNVAVHLPVFHEFMILPAMMYDSMVLGTDRLDVNVTHAVDTAWASGAITAAAIASNALANAKFADGAITAAKFAANAITSTVMADGTITAAKIAAAALSIAKFATDIGTTAYASNPIAKAVCERLVSAMTTAGSLGERIERLDILAAGGAGELTAARAGYLANLSGGAVALASVLGAVATAAGTGDPDSSKTVIGYIKQLVNILIGTDGIASFPAEAAPDNAVSLAEVIRAIHVDVTGLNGSVMRGTDSAALASVCTEARLAELAAANLPADIDAILTDTGTTLENRLIAIEADTDAIDDIPTTAEFEARTLPSADYTVVSDLGTVQSGDSYAIVNGDHGLVSIQDDVDAILEDTGTTLENRLIAIEADTDVIDDGTSGLVKIATDVAAILVDTGTTLDGKIDTIVTDVLGGVIEGTYTIQDCMKIILAYMASKATGGGTPEVTFRDTADTKDRIVMAVDGNGNRSAITVDVT